jgi:diadenylate cyclase
MDRAGQLGDFFHQQIDPVLKNVQVSLVDVVDVLVVAYLLYRLLMLVRGSRAWRIVLGIVTFVFVLALSKYLQLHTLNWLMDKATILGPVALVILFLPELRQAIEGFGKLGFWPQKLGLNDTQFEAHTVEEIVAAVAELAAQSVGALIVIERGAPLDEIVANGVLVQARVSAPLIGSIFYEGNPLHDGAVVVRGDRIEAAACRLPLSESVRLDQNVHMRHRAAVGVTEMLDCISIVVSEERGTISIAADGRLRRLATHLELRDFLNRELRGTKDADAVHRKPLLQRREKVQK